MLSSIHHGAPAQWQVVSCTSERVDMSMVTSLDVQYDLVKVVDHHQPGHMQRFGCNPTRADLR